MGRKQKYSKEILMEVIERYDKGESSGELSLIYGISQTHISTTIRKYKAQGESILDVKPRNRKYSKELKEAAIKEYLEGKESLRSISNKYAITSKGILRKWVIKYNSHIETKDYNPKPEVYMAKSRKTTYEERIEIVQYCLEHELNYKETAIKYGVTYAQVFTWVKKYKANGEEGLTDKRGRIKLESEMTEEEKLRHQLKREQARNKYLKMEVDALKKLEEIERQEIEEKNKKKSIKQSKH